MARDNYVQNTALWRTSLADVDPQVSELLLRERERQEAGLHLLAPSMLVSTAVRECLASELGNLDGEGYVGGAHRPLDDFLTSYDNDGSSKFNPSGPFAEYVEVLAQRRVATAFSAGTALSPDALSVNVHPASGSIANLAVCYGLLAPGSTVLSLSTSAGGHISHGAAFHRSGQDFDFVHVDLGRSDSTIDYAGFEAAFRRHRPSAVFVGASSFPRHIDWARLRRIVDTDPAAGCVLIADVAHFAGPVVTGHYPNPLPAADVVTFVGYKTFGGPKSAGIICQDPAVAKRVARSLFPGIQGAPRMAEIAAMAVAAQLSGTPEFRRMMTHAVELAQGCAEELRKLGMTLAFDGTDTHMLLIDVGPAAQRLASDLESVGVFANANLLPGDPGPSRSTGLRIGTVGVAQRGLTPDHAPELARLLHEVIRQLEADGDNRDKASRLVTEFVQSFLR
jgi:glycine hydroxymethyltransferase